MKKLISTFALGATLTTHAIAMPTFHYTGRPDSITSASYDVGYRHGKNSAYHNVATVIVVGGIILFAGLAVYQLGQESRLGFGENGLTYRF